MPIIIDADKCTGDGKCVEVCPVEVIAMKNGKAVVADPDSCIECECCISVCDSSAIEMA